MAFGENPAQKGSHPVPVARTMTERKKGAFLIALTRTGTIRGAAAEIGLHYTTIYDHAKKDPTFANDIERARNSWEQGLVDRVIQGANTGDVITRADGTTTTKPGDWRAAAWLLEHAPHTREHYAGILKQKVTIAGDPDGVPVQHDTTVQIEIGPDTQERLALAMAALREAGVIRYPDPGEIIEGEAEEVGDG